MTSSAGPSFEAIGPWSSDSKVALACSGGADSTFLALKWLDFARSLGGQAPPAIVWVVDHGHRTGSAEEARKAKAIYLKMGLEAHILQAHREEKPPKGESGLRELRYGLFAKAAIEGDVSVILTAHHADDQAETVLLRILRGTGLRGLAGIPERRWLTEFEMPDVEIRRPLLKCRGAQIRKYLSQVGQNWIEDPTNIDSRAAVRNFLRHDVFPLLAASSPADPISSFLKLADEAQSWREWVGKGFLEDGQDWLADWEHLPSVLRREGIAEILRRNQHVVSRRRVMDLEGALLNNRSASVDEIDRICIAKGRLRLERRSDPQKRR